MNHAAFHLNFLKPEERRSPSPIRLRVMLPLLAMLACAGMGVWWGTVFTQLMVKRADINSVRADIAATTPHFERITRQLAECNELTAQLAQLEGYRAGVRHLGEPFAKLAEIMPLKVQLTEISITPPAPQNLKNPVPNQPPLWGPLATVETQKVIFVGRAAKQPPVKQLKTSLSDPIFAPLVSTNEPVIKTERGKSDATRDKLLFEFSYTMPGRTFAK